MLPTDELIEEFQLEMKDFCENTHGVVRNNKSTFQDDPSITFYQKKTRLVVIFDRFTKEFRSAYKLTEPQATRYELTGEIGIY